MVPMSLKDTLKTFSEANVLRLYVGNFTVFLGFWLSFLSIIWLVYQLTQSSFSLGVMGLVLSLPIFLLLPFAGVLADRFSKRKILLWCAAGLLLTPALLIWATWTKQVSITLLVIVAPIYGAFYAMMNPAVTSFIKEVVEREEDVHRVTGLMSSNTKIAQLFAAAINGLLHLALSITSVFIAAFISHVLSLIAFFRIRHAHETKPIEHAHGFHQFLEGVRYTFSFSPFWSVLMMASTGSLIILGWQWQLPVYTGNIIGGGSKTLSLLFLFGGIGGIVGGVYISLRHQSAGLMRLATFALLIIAVGLVCFSFSSNQVVSTILTFFIDAGWVMLLATTSATLQLIVEDNKRGRVMSFYAMGVFGLMPFTNFLIGALCAEIGVTWGTFVMGCFCGLIALFYYSGLAFYREKLLPLYLDRGMGELERPI